MNATTATNPVLDKIKALLAKAEATTFEAEAELFRTKAFDLMMREGFTEKDLREVDSSKFVSKRIKLKSTTWREDIYLLMTCADANGLVLRMQQYDARQGGAFGFLYGPAHLIEQAELMFVMLHVQCVSACRRRNKYETQNEFHAGFALGVKHNLASAIADVAKDAPGVGLVLKSLHDQIEDKIGSGRASRMRAAAPGSQGLSAGATADANMRARVAASGRKAIG